MSGRRIDGDRGVTAAGYLRLDQLEQKLEAGFRAQRREISLEIASAMNYTVARNQENLERTFARFREEMFQEIARVCTANAEESRRELRAVDEQYRDLPNRVAVLERGLEEHQRDAAVHKQPRSRRRPG
jgi:hypothetical protein